MATASNCDPDKSPAPTPAPHVTVCTTGPQCLRCTLTCRCLDAAGIPFKLVDLRDERSEAMRVWITEDLGYTEAPVVLVDDDPEHHWSGFRPDLIDKLNQHRSTMTEDVRR